MSRLSDIEGFVEANDRYENANPDDFHLVCEFCDGEGCPECDPEEDEE
jgi:hypothetical protein